MISVSQTVVDLINADSRTFRAKFKHGDNVYDEIMNLKWSICLPSSAFSVGNALSMCVQCSAYDVPVSIKGEELELILMIEGSDKEISIGDFTAEKPTVQNGIVSFTAYDYMVKAGDIPYNSKLGEGVHTVNEYLADVAETIGIGYSSLGTAGNVDVETDYLSGNSCRNALAYLAAYIGRNCIIKNKQILMKEFTLVDYIMNADRIAEPELEDIDSEIDFIIAQISSSNTIMNGIGTTGTEFVCPIMTETQLSSIANMLLGDNSPVKNYRAGKINLILGDPRLELCDVIKLDYNGAVYSIPITSISFEYDGGLMTDIEAFTLKEPTLLTPAQRLDFAVQEEVKKVLEQIKNIDGTYFYVRYSANADGSNMMEDPDDKTEYIGVCSTNQSSAPTDSSAYTWSKFKGSDGSNNFFHVKYSDDGGKTFTGNDGEDAGEYIGVLVDTNETDSANPSDYTWSKIKGSDGKGIKEIKNYYLTTAESSGVTRNTSGWETSVTPVNKDKPYLWNYEEIIYTEGNPSYTEPCIIGNFAENGTEGRGIKSITEYYATSKTSTAPQKTSFFATVQTPTSDVPFLWNYEVIEYTDGESYESAVRLIGVYGEKGAKGDNGDTLYTWVKYADDANGTNMSDSPTGKSYIGIAYNKTTSTESNTASDYAWSLLKGSDGRGVSKVVTQYYLSTSETTQTGGSWSEDAPTWEDGKHLWTRLATTYTDGITEYSDPVVDASWKKTSVVDEASKELNETLANALGLHVTEYAVVGGTIRYYHSNPTLTASAEGDTILVFNSNGFGVCKTGWNSGSPVFTYGTTFDGKAVWDILTANYINADLIKAGTISSLGTSGTAKTTLNLKTGEFSFESDSTLLKIQSAKEDDDGVETEAGMLLESTAEDKHWSFSLYGVCFNTIEYIIALLKYNLGTASKPEDPYYSTIKEQSVKTRDIHCKNIYIVGTDGNEYNLLDELSLMADEVNSLGESLTALQEKYTALLESIGQTCDHSSTTTKKENVVAPTCTETGSYDNVVYCAACGEEISRETITTDALGHSYTSVVTPPTETEQGYTTHTCSRCGHSYVDSYTEPTGCQHEYSSTIVEPTCTEQGYTLYTCLLCGATYKDSYTEATGHESSAFHFDMENVVEPTCTESGSYTKVSKCTKCDAELSRSTITVEATGHTDEDNDGLCDTCGAAVGAFYDLTIDVSPAGAGTVTGAGSYLSGSTATITATPESGYVFKHWLLAGTTIYTSNPLSVYVSGRCSFTAVFEEDSSESKNITISRSGVGSTKIVCNGTQLANTANVFTYDFDIGDEVTLTFTPDSGYSFGSWINDDTLATVSWDNPYTFTVDASTPSKIGVAYS